MVEIAPFRGYRFNQNIVESFASVIAPPYDVIDAELQKTLHSRSNFNISVITKGEKHADDTDSENQYTRAAVLLNQWIDKDVLVQDEKPTIYVLAQEFNIGTSDDPKTMTRAGFIALLKLEDFCTGGSSGTENTVDPDNSGPMCVGVHQHEETLAKDIEDRLCLCKTTLTNFGQIFAIFPDHQRKTEELLAKLMASEPIEQAIDDEGVTHKLWLMQDEGLIAEIKALLANKSIIIADGHHRYKTALKLHQDHNGPEDPVRETSKYRMLTFVNMMNEGLVILPTHRLVQRIDGFDADILLAAIEPDFLIESFSIEELGDNAAKEKMFASMKTAFDHGKNVLGLYCKTGNYYLLTLKDISAMDKVPHRSTAWRQLDVSILHRLILEDHLGIDKAKLASGTINGGAYVEYIKDIGDAVQKAIDKVNNSGYQAVFFMNPTRAQEVEAVATNHETMPQKSTFFYPKIYTGYVISKL